MSQLLSQSIDYLKGVGPQRGDILKNELQVFTLNDLLHHFPFRYIDRRKIHTTKDVLSQKARRTAVKKLFQDALKSEE